MAAMGRRSLVTASASLLALAAASPGLAKVASLPVASAVAGENDVIDGIMHSTLRIECTGPGGTRYGTGIVFTFLTNALAVVTNKHLLAGATSCRMTFTAATASGLPDLTNHIPVQITDLANGSIPHPDDGVDLVIFPLAPLLRNLQQMGKTPFFRSAGPDMVPTRPQLETLLPLQDVLTLGYPGELWDNVNNLPIVTRSVTATPPAVDFQGRKELLINEGAWVGSGGSPVFANVVQDPPEGSTASFVGIMYLIGVVYGIAIQDNSGNVRIGDAPTELAQQAPLFSASATPTNLCACIAAERILEFEPLLLKHGLTAPEGYLIRATSQADLPGR